MRPACHKFVLAVMLIFGFAGIASADETIIYTYPDIAPDVYIEAGWRSVDPSAHAGDAAEYMDLDSFMTAAGDVMLFPFPHRIHFEYGLDGPNDYFGDISYAYSDIVLARWIKRSLYHNMGTIELVDLNPDSGFLDVDMRDRDEDYGVSFSLDTVSLRLKPLDYPLHLFMDAAFVHKEGDIQQIFMSGSSSIERASESRRIDWETDILGYGSNMHLGPVEVELSHEDKRFLSGGQSVMTEHYEASASNTEGDYPHNLIPNLEGHSDSLKVHTSYTGRFTASANISRGVRYNRDSGAESDTVRGGATAFLRPVDRLFFTFKYHHSENDVSNPDSLKSGYLGYSSYDTALTGVKDSMSTAADEYSVVAKLHTGRWATISAEYDLGSIHRIDADQWELPSLSVKTSLKVSAWGTFPWHLKWRAEAARSEMDSPAYNTDSDSANTGAASLTWSPIDWFSAYAGYACSRGVRDELNFAGDDLDVDAENRLLKHQQLTASVSLPITSRVGVSGGYMMMLDRVRQDMVYVELVDKDVRYKDQSHSYFTSVTYMPMESLSLQGGVTHTVAVAHYLPDEELVTSYSEVSSTQTSYTASADYTFHGGWSAGLSVEYADFNDLVEDGDNPTVSDGNVFVVSVKLAGKW